MGVQLVSDVYDIAALTAQHEQFIALLKESKASIIDLNNQRITVKGSSLAEFTKETQELNKAINTSTDVTNKAAAAKDKLVTSTVKSIEADKKQVQLDREKIKVKQEEEKLDQQKERTAQQKLKTSQQEARAKEIEAKYTKNIVTEKEKLESAIQKELKVQEKLNNSYEQLKAKYLIASNTAKNLAAEELKVAAAEGAQSTAAKVAAENTKQATAAAAAYHVQLLKIEQSVGQSQRNVGNYASATMALTQVLREAPAFANSFATGISGISNNIPILIDQFKILKTQLGSNMAAFGVLARSMMSFTALLPIGFLLVQMYGKEIVEFFKNLFAGKEKIDSVKESVRLLNEVYSEGNKKAAERIIDLKLLYAASTDVTLAEKDRLAATVALKKEFPEVFKNISTEIIMNGKAKKSYDDLIISIQAASRAEAAKEKLVGIEKQRLDIARQVDKINNATTNEMNRVKNLEKLIGPKKVTDDRNPALEQEKLKINTRKSNALKDQKDKDDALQRESDFLIKFVGINKLAQTVIDDNTTKDKKTGADSLQELKERKDTEFDIYKVNQEAKIRIFENEIKDERTYYLDKLTALDNYVKARKELLDKEEANEIALAKAEAAREVQHLEESKAGKSKDEKARIDENIKITEQNLVDQLLLIQTVYADRSIQLVEDSGRTRQEIIDRQHEQELRSYEEFKKDMEAAEKRNQDRIDEGFKRRAEQEKDFAAKMLQLQKEINERKAQVALQGEDFLYNLATASFERQLNLIQDQKNLIDQRKAADLAANDALVQSEQDKAANIAIINSRAQIQKEALDRKAAEIENRKAQFDRAQQLFEISIATIKAIAQIKIQAAILAANPYGGAILAAKALTQIPLVLISSALSIGALFAKPLPRYKGGRGEGREEVAITGDGGVPEFIHREDGTIQQTPAVETITHLMPKDKVYKDKATMMKELAISAIPMSDYVVNASGGIDKADMEKFTGRIEEAVGNIQINTLLITKEGWREQNKRLAEYNRWVDTVVKQ